MEFLNKKEITESEEKGLNFTIPLTLIGRIIGHAIFPAAIMIALYITQHFFAGFWSEILMVIGITTLSMLILHSNDVVRENDDVIQVLRDSLVIGTGSVLLTRIISHYAIGQNTFGSVPMVISILLVVFGLVLTSFSDPHSYYQNKAYQKACTIFAKIISTLVTVCLLGSIYKTIGTQYVWLPAISLWVFWFYFSYDEDLTRKFGTHSEVMSGLTIVIFTICLISTLYQFWFSMIVFGFNLWQCLLGISILAIIIISLVFYKKHRDEKLAKKISAEKEEAYKAKKKELDLKVKEDADKATQDRLVKLNLATEAIKTETEQKWSEILFVSHWRKDDHQTCNIILPKIHMAPLSQLVEISKIKKQIAFNPSNLEAALELINRFTERNYADETLKGFVDQVSEFINLIHQFNDFKGYEDTLSVVRTKCPAVCKLISDDKLKEIIA